MDKTYPCCISLYVKKRYIRMSSDKSCFIKNEPKKENDIEYPLLVGSTSFLSYTEECSPLLQREPTHGSAGTNISSLIDANGFRQLNRSRSESTLRMVNDTIGKWKREITRIPQLFHNTIPTPRPTEIQYSVFKPPAHIMPLQYIPSAGFLNSGPITKEKFDICVNQAKEAIEHDIQPQMIASGSSGSYFIYNRSKNIIAVFKPQDEEPYGPLSPKMTKWIHRNFFPCFFGRSCLIPNTGYIAESAASLIDRQLQSFIVPYTDSVTLSSPSFYYPVWETWENRFKGNTQHRPKIGSFQLFLDKYQCADEFFRKYPFPQSIPQSANPQDRHSFHWNVHTLQNLREELEKLVILDFIIRNTDRGLDNWMLKIDYDTIDSYGNPRLVIGAIDNGLSFPWKHPNEWRSFPYGWLFLPISIIGQPFSQKTRNHYLPLLTSVKWWEDTTILMREMFSRDPGFKERMFRKQMAVLKGQAWNIVEVLKSPREGPLELARKLRMLVVDQEIEVPINNPISLVMSAMETPIFDQPPSENTVNNKLLNNSEFQGKNKSASSPIVSLPAIRETQDSKLDEGKEMNKSLQQNWDQLLNGEIDETAYQLNNSCLLDQDKNVKVRDGNHKQNLQEYHESSIILSNGQNNNTCQIKLISPGTKSVIIERLQPVSSKPPVFTCC